MIDPKFAAILNDTSDMGPGQMTNDQLLDALIDANGEYDRARNVRQERDAQVRASQLRVEILRRMLPKAGGEEAIDAIRDQIECPYVCFGGSAVRLDGCFTLDQLKTICAELAK